MITVGKVDGASIQCDECEHDTPPTVRIKMTLENIYLCEDHTKELYQKLGEVLGKDAPIEDSELHYDIAIGDRSDNWQPRN